VNALPFSPACAAGPVGRRGGRIPDFLMNAWKNEDEQEVESAVEQNVRLTEREADVLRLLARGRSYAQAASELGVSAHTVSTHVKNAYRKLDVHSAAAAVLQAVRLGLIL
jgi:DNA-binding CsgD family transcriptional regulator